MPKAVSLWHFRELRNQLEPIMWREIRFIEFIPESHVVFLHSISLHLHLGPIHPLPVHHHYSVAETEQNCLVKFNLLEPLSTSENPQVKPGYQMIDWGSLITPGNKCQHSSESPNWKSLCWSDTKVSYWLSARFFQLNKNKYSIMKIHENLTDIITLVAFWGHQADL